MPSYKVIVPGGVAVLEDTQTGHTIPVVIPDGTLTLGTITDDQLLVDPYNPTAKNKDELLPDDYWDKNADLVKAVNGELARSPAEMKDELIIKKVLENAIETLTVVDFDDFFEVMANLRNRIEGQVDYLEEIEAPKEEVEECFDALEVIDKQLSAGIARKTEFDDYIAVKTGSLD